MESSSGHSRRGVLAAVLSCLAGPALAQTPAGYTVEIIVFRNGSESGALAATTARATFTGDDVAPTGTGTRKLGGAVTRLNGGGKRVLGHAAWKQAPTSFNSRRGVSTARVGLEGITGKVIFERGTYLHLGIDLEVEDAGRRYRLNEVRRVKTDELHYFDHPAIGVMAILSAE